jgi:hypothetical protein
MSVYVGIDVHRMRSQVAVVTENGQVQLNKNTVNGTEPILRLIGDLPAGTPVAFEAAFGWGWLVHLLEDYGFDPHLVHPLRCKAIASARFSREDPRRAGLARAAPPGGGRLHGQQLVGGGLADLGELGRRERGVILVFLGFGGLVLLADPVQPRHAFLRRRRVAVQRGEVLVSPRVCGTRLVGHEPPLVRDEDSSSNILANIVHNHKHICR